MHNKTSNLHFNSYEILRIGESKSHALLNKKVKSHSFPQLNEEIRKFIKAEEILIDRTEKRVKMVWTHYEYGRKGYFSGYHVKQGLVTDQGGHGTRVLEVMSSKRLQEDALD